MNRLHPRIVIPILLLLVSLVLAGTAMAQDTSWCVSPDGTPVGCAEITIAPAGTVGDFFINDVPIAVGQNPGRLILPAGTYTVKVRNAIGTEAGFGTLFVYNEGTTSVTIKAGQVVTKTVTLTKKFIRGTMGLTCDIRGAVAGVDDVSCMVTIDGVPQPEVLPPGTVRNYVLDPGSHAVNVALVGGSAQFWSPASRDQSVRITAGPSVTPVKPQFVKKGHLHAVLDQPNTVGDWYLDGVLVGTQVPSIDQWVEPSKNHKIEVKLINDPTANGLYMWKDASTTANLTPGQTKTVTVKLTKVWLKGFIELTCNITNFQAGMSCNPVLDGVPQPLVPHGGVATYTVNPGAHKLVVNIEPASDFGSTPKTFNSNVQGGKTAKVKATLTAVVPTFNITVVNNSYTVICNLWITPIGTPRGTDLVISLGKGQSKTFTVGKGTYDLYAENCEENPLELLGSVTMTQNFTWTVNGPTATQGSPMTLRLINNSGIDICFVQASPSAFGIGGQNWLRPGQVLASGQNQDLLLNTGEWDLYAQSCDGNIYWNNSHMKLTTGIWSFTFLGIGGYFKDGPRQYGAGPQTE